MPYSSVYLVFYVILMVGWGKEREEGQNGLSLVPDTSCLLNNSGRKKYVLSVMMCEMGIMIFKMCVLFIEEVMWKK